MSVVQEPTVEWTPDMMIEVLLNEPDDLKFLKFYSVFDIKNVSAS